ncbi:hypothetical protein M8C13_07615 [Crossiella sp. SN42]|uniref:hypothetical protein n=1 Tax=Crossiella sp. SN42 TaxID=2944808 RepID=UPI00207CEECE|nr:hypothetical protein [Crossiella sp. SN42]MCO1575625.1 hypothetical protein [Crossiella sp. SN42]
MSRATETLWLRSFTDGTHYRLRRTARRLEPRTTPAVAVRTPVTAAAVPVEGVANTIKDPMTANAAITLKKAQHINLMTLRVRVSSATT